MPDNSCRLPKGRRQIEAELHARLAWALADYEKSKIQAARKLSDASALRLDTPDGLLAMRKVNQHLAAVHEALITYEAALKAFTEFVLSDKLPPDLYPGD